MLTRTPLFSLVTLTLVSIGSLGATDCAEETVRRLIETVANHEVRIDALEHCDCEGILAPVCGENGKTYLNVCEARCAQVEIESPGRCERPECGGPHDTACGDGEFCDTHPGCEAGAPGICAEIPEICTDEVAPVCGCDGHTYSNDCDRRAAGVSLAHRGSCEEPPEFCDANDDCEATDYCRKREGVCGDGRGACVARPELCTLHYDPVCGCDGKTYSNACAAATAGVSVEDDGACEDEPIACGHDSECAPDAFCQKRVGHCDAEGVCMPRPEVCPLQVARVCGCDGETYDNECAASAAGLSLSSSEVCPEPHVPICHIPPGNPGNRHTIRVGESAAPAHLGHGDYEGPCRD